MSLWDDFFAKPLPQQWRPEPGDLVRINAPAGTFPARTFGHIVAVDSGGLILVEAKYGRGMIGERTHRAAFSIDQLRPIVIDGRISTRLGPNGRRLDPVAEDLNP